MFVHSSAEITLFLLKKRSCQNYKFDVFTISESMLDSSVSDLEIEIPGYSIHTEEGFVPIVLQSYTTGGVVCAYVLQSYKTGGVVCAYVLQSYKTEVLSDLSNISDCGFHQLWLKIQVRNLKLIIVCTAYRPPDTPLINISG